MELIKFKNVSKVYSSNGVRALNNVTISIQKGDFVFVIGGSGSGKSTLIKMLYREEKATSGEVIVGGINVSKLRNSKVYKLRRKIGVVYQDYKLLPKLNVYENVAFALEVTGADSKTIRKKVVKILELVGLKEKIKQYPSHLSGGEQQRVAIARAIVNDPKILICDEPTGNLDPKMSLEIMNVLSEINKELGTTIIMVSHDTTIVEKYKKRVLVLKDGNLIKDYEGGTYKNENV